MLTNTRPLTTPRSTRRSAAVAEGVERSHDVVAVDPEIERKVVTRARRYACVGQVELRRDRRDDRLRAVAAGHRKPVGAAGDSVPDELFEILPGPSSIASMPRAGASVASENFSALPPPDFGLKTRTGCSGATLARGALARSPPRARVRGRSQTPDDHRDLQQALVHESRIAAANRPPPPKARDPDRAPPQDPVEADQDGQPNQAERDQASGISIATITARTEAARPNTRAPSAATPRPLIGSPAVDSAGTEPSPDAGTVHMASRRRARRRRRVRGDRTNADAALDTAMARLTRAADYSRLSIARTASPSRFQSRGTRGCRSRPRSRSGHSAAAFAFAAGVGHVLPRGKSVDLPPEAAPSMLTPVRGQLTYPG